MGLTKELFGECINRNLHISITYQKMNDYSVEIYAGYKSNYKEVFYTDGFTSKKKAVKKALKFLRKEYTNGV